MAGTSGKASVRNETLAKWEDTRDVGFHSKHKIFLSHSGAQKDFVEQLCVDLERWDRQPFFDKRRDSLPVGENFPKCILAEIRQCQVGVVILSEEFFTRSKWPMIELVAMVREAKMRKSGFKVVPVFLGMSIDEFRDAQKRSGWQECWHELALKDKRIDMQEWEGALKHLEPLNSMVYDGMGEVKFRRDIVDVICGVVPLDTRLEDSHVQGRLRLCEVIQGQISRLEVEKSEGVVLVGLYGVGGIGKTSICKALCNEYVTRFHGRVCHAELERKGREELLREVLKRFTDTSCEVLDRWNEDELMQKLSGGIIKVPIFLVVDNVSDVQVSIAEAKRFVSARLPSGSIVMVTSRSKETLKLVRADLVDNNVMEMPELEVEEARSLFCRSCEMESGCEVDDRVVKRCVERCYFKKGDGNGGYHYHPLTLDVLGKQLAYIDVEEWEAHLDRIDKDVFNQSGEVEHQVFSILRKSYDLLTPSDKLLFMDVALFLVSSKVLWVNGYNQPEFKLNIYEWLGMVHTISVDDVVFRLKRLRRKSLLENLGDGIEMSIGMHDLWRAFCEVEVQSGELRCRRWIYGAKRNVELMERCPVGGCWENVARMSFLVSDSRSDLERVDFSYFPNITILNVTKVFSKDDLLLDLGGLRCLKSLVIEGNFGKVVLLDLPRCLVFLRLASSGGVHGSWDKVVKQVGYLTKLEHLELFRYGGDKLPDMKSMVSLRVAIFYYCYNVVNLIGLSTKLSNLRVLHIIECHKFRSCPSLGDLVELENLSFKGCRNLKRLPNLGKLTSLRKLVLTGCRLINKVSGLGDLVALEELRMGDYKYPSGFSYSVLSLDVRSLKNLRTLSLPRCRLGALPGFDALVVLEDVEVDFGEHVVKPSLGQLTKLKALRIPHGWNLERLSELNNLVMLHNLVIEGCYGVDNLPNIQGLISLKTLKIEGCGFKSIGALSNATTLKNLEICRCKLLERLPGLQGLIKLEYLRVCGCDVLRKWDCKVGAMEGSSLCPSVDDYVGSKVPNYQMLMALKTLDLRECPIFEDVMVIGAFSNLQRLLCWDLNAIFELPNLSSFPQLVVLDVMGCERLRRLTIREPIHALTSLRITDCSSLMTLPDLINLPCLELLDLHRCNRLLRLSASETLHSLQELDFYNDGGMEELPDLGMFPALKSINLEGCTKLRLLKSSKPLHALNRVVARRCTSLSGVDLDELQALCPQSEIKRGDVIERTRSRWRFIQMFQKLIELYTGL